MSRFAVEPGILLSIINSLHHQGSTVSEYDRLCVLSFDETAVAQDWSYDIGNDTLFDPKRSVQCAMIRGLIKPWKQLVFYELNCDMTRYILFNIILEVEADGFVVVAVVSDLGPTDLRLWKTVDINVNNTSFSNPYVSNRPIFVFACAPHLLKLIRNNLLDHRFTLHGNSKPTVTNSSVREIIIRSEYDLKTSHRLSHKHINVEGAKRMNVRLAAQLRSETTAKSVRYFGKQGLLNWEDTSNFIALVDAWFDVLNSKRANAEKYSRSGFGIHLKTQTDVLNSMLQTIRDMNVGGRDSLYQFQKGIIVSSQSLLRLYEFLQNSFEVGHILTYTLNQDCLEHMFGYLRQMEASYQHPSVLQVKYRIRSYLLGRNCELVGSRYNINKENQDNPLTEGSFSVKDVGDSEHDISDTEPVESEFLPSAMLFSSDPRYDTGGKNDSTVSSTVQKGELEECMKSLRYVGGFIAHKLKKIFIPWNKCKT